MRRSELRGSAGGREEVCSGQKGSVEMKGWRRKGNKEEPGLSLRATPDDLATPHRSPHSTASTRPSPLGSRHGDARPGTAARPDSSPPHERYGLGRAGRAGRDRVSGTRSAARRRGRRGQGRPARSVARTFLGGRCAPPPPITVSASLRTCCPRCAAEGAVCGLLLERAPLPRPLRSAGER